MSRQMNIKFQDRRSGVTEWYEIVLNYQQRICDYSLVVETEHDYKFLFFKNIFTSL